MKGWKRSGGAGCLVVAWWLSNDGSVDSIVEWWLVVLLCSVDMVKGRRGGDHNKGVMQALFLWWL